jgi:hypothetical protein
MFVREISVFPFSAMMMVTIPGQLAVVCIATILRMWSNYIDLLGDLEGI